MHKYIEIFKYSFKMKMAFVWNYAFSLFSFAIHVIVFNELWDYILQGKLVAGYTKEELIWYIIIAEFITHSNEKKYKDIARMVKQGDIANMLIKPVDIVNYFIAEDSALIIKTTINFICGMVLGTLLLGRLNITFGKIILTVIASLIGVFIGILVQILVGILSFFTEENNSIYLILQKLSFFVVFTPLEFYPSIARKFLSVLPTTYFVYAPSKIFSNASLKLSLELLGLEILSGIILYIIIRLIYRKGVKNINVNGG